MEKEKGRECAVCVRISHLVVVLRALTGEKAVVAVDCGGRRSRVFARTSQPSGSSAT